jgi:hypothetical protein
MIRATSSLLWDAVRVLVGLLREADTLIGGSLVWRDHRRAAKKRARSIKFTRGRPNRVEHYRELIKLTRATLAYADQATTQLWQVPDPLAVTLWQAEFNHYRPLVERIIAQTERRVLKGEAVAASEKRAFITTGNIGSARCRPIRKILLHACGIRLAPIMRREISELLSRLIYLQSWHRHRSGWSNPR